ncbi:mitochondrial 37S ribosomal protein bS21m [Metarhizium brunneum]|uniref:37S ribosomal protein mrp21 n=1 Tax=Metarhizium brunneum TaxID=500148 RepID=A0A7D5Z216_9HYPO
MLSRMAVTSPVTVLATRAFSTALPLRIASSKPTYNASSPNPRGPVRSNPLVGNYAPAEPTKPRDKPTHSTSSSPNASVPPPPPPPASAAPAIPEPQENPAHAYDAVSRTNITIDLANIISEKASSYAYKRSASNPMDMPKVRTKAVSGRTVFIQDRLSPTSAPTPMVALRVLEKMCRDQKIKNKFHSQKFHERKGLKKKRLRSQRWRSRFKTGFKAAVNRVMELKKQGW